MSSTVYIHIYIYVYIIIHVYIYTYIYMYIRTKFRKVTKIGTSARDHDVGM